MSEERNMDFMEAEEEMVPVIVLTDENGKEKEYEILASFESDDGKNYVIYFDEEEEEGSIYAARLEEMDGVEQLLPLETDEEWDMVDEVLRRLDEDEAEEE